METQQPPSESNSPASDKYAILDPDPSWCGPRVVYFFACYFGNDYSLEEVVSLCKTNEIGYTSLLDLVNACRSLGLEPTPISCSAQEILSLGGPAIICVEAPQREQGKPSGRIVTSKSDLPVLHFVGLVAREDDHFLVFNPGLSMECFRVSDEGIRREFTGQAVLLRGCPRPPLALRWLSFPWVFLTFGLVFILIIGLSKLAKRVGPAFSLSQ
jgi:ABC-type bacteriocin/lantibiotic exporter with double-glycine peptidase domain